MRKNKGFTILELLVVVAIIAILSAIAIPNFVGRIEDAKASQELAEINAVEKAMANYYVDNGTYPTLQGKDGTLLQPQPIEGSPHNIDFSSLVPNYLASLPHFSYWWVDERGDVFHTQKIVGNVVGGVFTPTTGYTYTIYKTNGTTQVLSAPYTLLTGEYIIGKDDQGNDLPKISTNFKNAKMHPEDPEYVVPVVFTPQTFAYTGGVQTFTVPANGTYQLEVWGASGGLCQSNLGFSTTVTGNGGYASGQKYLTAGTVLYVYVGSQGSNGPSSGGWNGGGSGVGVNWGKSAGGGGATDFRTVSGTWNDTTGLNSRLIVAGGGGGGNWTAGGAGGGLTGGTGGDGNGHGYGGLGGTQTAGGSAGALTASAKYPGMAGTFGKGGDGPSSVLASGASAGGGGWYGGGSASAGDSIGGAGGGGSSYTGTLTNAVTISGSATMPTATTGTMTGNLGHGKAKISYVGP